jgi:hypothetical protein
MFLLAPDGKTAASVTEMRAARISGAAQAMLTRMPPELKMSAVILVLRAIRVVLSV